MFRVTKLVMMQTGGINDQFARPFNPNLNADNLAHIQSVTDGGQIINSAVLSGVAGSILRPSAQHEGLIQIPNGWREQRLRFFMEVELGQDALGGAANVQVLTGFTDYVGATVNGNIDPNMQLYFNSAITLRRTNISTPNGMVMGTHVVDASQILTGKAEMRMGSQGTVHHAMRPQDVFAVISQGALGDSMQVNDTRHTFVNGPMKSNRTNALAPEYLSKTLRAQQQAEHRVDTYESGDEIANVARGIVQDPNIGTDLFFGTLKRHLGFGEGDYITYGALCQLDPNTDNIASVIMVGNGMQQVSAWGVENTAHWNGANMETVAATILSQAVPAIMMELMLSEAHLMATNETLNGEYLVTMQHFNGFSDKVDPRPYAARLLERLKVEVLRDLTQNNLIQFRLTMNVKLTGETMISISMNGQPAIDFVCPSFCDSLMAPVITTNKQTLYGLAHDLSSLFTNIDTKHQHHNNFLGGLSGHQSSL